MNSHLAYFIYFDYYFSQSGYEAFLQLYNSKGYWYVAWKVNTCWPNFRIWKYTLSAFYGYFYSSHKPSGGSEKSYIVKKVPKRFKAITSPPQGEKNARYRKLYLKMKICCTGYDWQKIHNIRSYFLIIRLWLAKNDNKKSWFWFHVSSKVHQYQFLNFLK